jgi:hypothetical protein
MACREMEFFSMAREGTGKTLLARAAAGEFGLDLVYISAPKPTRSIRLARDGRMLWGIQAAPGGNSTTSPWR